MYLLEEIDGETGQPGKEFLSELNDSALRIVRHIEEYGIAQRAAEARRIRHCLWKGQHWTERQWDTDEQAAFPFPGASDFRFRAADFLVNQRVAETFTALMRAQVSFGAPGPKTTEAAEFCAKVWKDIKNRELTLEWIVQHLLLANYLHGGGRGVAGMWVGWKQESELRPKRVSTAELMAAWVELRVAQGEDAAAAAESFDGAFQEPVAGMDGLADILRETAMAKNARDARAAAKALRNFGTCDIAVPIQVCNRPEVRALALGDTLWIPPETPVADLDSTGELHLTEWYDRAQLRSMATREKWDPRFTEELIGDGKRSMGAAGKAVVPVYELANDDEEVSRVEANPMRDRDQIVRSFIRGVDRDGVTGRYECVWNPEVKEFAAKGLRLVREAHGKWPVQIYASEVAGPFALDSRGLPALAAGVQSHGKIAHDILANVGMLQLSPVVTKGKRDQGQLILEPLGEIQLGINGSVEFMKPPQVPYALLQYMDRLERWRDEYFGVPNKDIPPQIWQNAQALRVWLHLAQTGETVRRVVSIFVDRLPPEALPPDMQDGSYNLPVQMRCDPREWDMEHLRQTAETLNSVIMPMDRKGSLNLDAVVRSFALGMLPEHTEIISKSEQSAAQDELEDEQKSLGSIRNGIRPRIPEGGAADYAGRLRMYQEMTAANPAVFMDLAPDKMALLKEHIAALTQQATQYGENREIGRYGAKKEVGAIEEA